MKQIVRAEQVKFDFEGLKAQWAEMLGRYYLDDNTLNPAYTIEVACPFCGSSSYGDEFNLNGFLHKSCAQCQTLYVSPRLSDACIEELYSDEFYNENYARSMLPVFERRRELIGKNKFTQIVSHWGGQGQGRILDIGAGIGEVLDVFLENGWETHAIEMNKVAVDWLLSRGHEEVFHGMLEDYSTEKRFDVIMAWNVLEHVLDPAAFLETIHKLLVPGGLLVTEVPHGQSLLVDIVKKTGMDPKRILIGEQHIVLYSTEAYVALHERNGFEKLFMQTNGLDCDTIFKENKVDVPDHLLAAMQECIDKKMYGDLLRGYWHRS